MRTLQITTQCRMNLKHTVIVADRSLHDLHLKTVNAPSLLIYVSFKNYIHLSTVKLRDAIREGFQNHISLVAEGGTQDVLNDWAGIYGRDIKGGFDAIDRWLSVFPPSKYSIGFPGTSDLLTEPGLCWRFCVEHPVPKLDRTSCFLCHFLCPFLAVPSHSLDEIERKCLLLAILGLR